MIEYVDTLDGVEARHLEGFFVGWPNPPSPERHLDVLRGSAAVVLARDEGRVVGFVTAVSDGVLSAYIPLLEVLPAYQSRGVGTELMRRMLHALGDLYMVDLCCDAALEPFSASDSGPGTGPWASATTRPKRAGAPESGK